MDRVRGSIRTRGVDSTHIIHLNKLNNLAVPQEEPQEEPEEPRGTSHRK